MIVQIGKINLMTLSTIVCELLDVEGLAVGQQLRLAFVLLLCGSCGWVVLPKSVVSRGLLAIG